MRSAIWLRRHSGRIVDPFPVHISRVGTGGRKFTVVDRWRRVAVHNRWVKDAKITESVHGDGYKRRFTATICGWTNWKMWEGDVKDISVPSIIKEVEKIRERILAGDDAVFAKESRGTETRAQRLD